LNYGEYSAEGMTDKGCVELEEKSFSTFTKLHTASMAEKTK